MKNRNPEITKFCPNCGERIERKCYGSRIEDYQAYIKRIYCCIDCYRRKPKKIRDAGIFENLTPLEFILREMNRTSNSLATRMAMATLAINYCHPKLQPVKVGKKEEKQVQAAEVLSSGRFGRTAPPSDA